LQYQSKLKNNNKYGFIDIHFSGYHGFQKKAYAFNNHGYLRNKSWKPECVGSFNMEWRILVFYPEPEVRDKIY
jgi:hypothetical protein